MSLKELLESSIKEFNKYRSPEAKAKLLNINKKKAIVSFTGIFCRTCGFYDYFDDFIIILKEKGLKAEIEKIEEIEEGAIVKFSINS